MPSHATLEEVTVITAHFLITSLISRVVIMNFVIILVASNIYKLLKLLKTIKIRDSERWINLGKGKILKILGILQLSSSSSKTILPIRFTVTESLLMLH